MLATRLYSKVSLSLFLLALLRLRFCLASSFCDYCCKKKKQALKRKTRLCKIPRIKTRGIWGRRRRKTHNRFPTMHAHRQRREKTTKTVYSTSVGSAALPGSEASHYTYTKVQRKTTEGTREKTKRISSTPTGQRREENEEEEKEKD